MIERYKDKVKVVIKNYPLPMHKYARKAAAAALVAGTKGKFWEFHEALYENMHELSDEKVREIASGFGLDPDEILNKMNSPEIKKIINIEIKNAEESGIDSTPTVIINRRELKKRSFGYFQRMIDEELKKQNLK